MREVFLVCLAVSYFTYDKIGIFSLPLAVSLYVTVAFIQEFNEPRQFQGSR